MTDRVEIAGLQIARELHDFVAGEVVAETGIDAEEFWTGFATIVADLGPKNRALLERRDELQAKIDGWYRDNGAPSDMEAYKGFLKEIGYLVPEGAAFKVATENVDPEIATIAGPQLVVPVMNARYALNAANARWGSLYDALYGTDAIPEDGGAEKGRGYNPGARRKGHRLGAEFPQRGGAARRCDVAGRAAAFRSRTASSASRWPAASSAGLKQPEKFAGYLGDKAAPTQFLLKNNGIHIEVLIDASSTIGKADPAHISDVWLESALTTIQDFEDSIAAVDAEDKVAAYRNWLGPDEGRPDRGGRARAARRSRASSTPISTTPRPTVRPSRRNAAR